MIGLIKALAEVNNFRVDLQPKGTYHPDDARLARCRRCQNFRAGADGLSINHANFCAATRSNTFDPLAHSTRVPLIKRTYRALRAKKATHSTGSWRPSASQLRRWRLEYYYRVDPWRELEACA